MSIVWDTKIAVILRSDLAGWQRANVTAFGIAGITAAHPEIVGEPYVDKEGSTSLPLLQQPVFVFEASPEKLQTITDRARRRDVSLALYPETIFATNNDADNRATIVDMPTSEITVAGIAIRGDSKEVDRVIKGASRHP